MYSQRLKRILPLEPPRPESQGHPCLLHLTREDALQRPGSLAAYDFAYTPPQFCLNFDEQAQELIRWALTGATDKEIASLLNYSVWTIRKRWKAIYDCVEEKIPELFPEAEKRRAGKANGKTYKRGIGKRSVLIRFFTEHPEELC